MMGSSIYFICLYMSLYVFICLYMSLYVFTCLYMSLYVFVCFYMSLYICLYTSLFSWNFRNGHNGLDDARCIFDRWVDDLMASALRKFWQRSLAQT